MKVNILIVGTLVTPAFAAGWYAASYGQKLNATSQAKQRTAQSVATPTKDIYSGNGMSPEELYNELAKQKGVDFDKRYINYVILMQANATGINRLAKQQAVAPTLQAKAAELWALDTQRLSELYALQKQLGYTHH